MIKYILLGGILVACIGYWLILFRAFGKKKDKE